MAQAVQSTIIDLTGEDDNEDSIARAHAAYGKAFAAASRLTSSLESLKTSKPDVYQSPYGNADLITNGSLSATVPKAETISSLATFPEPVRSEKNGLKKDANNKAILRRDSSVLSSGNSVARSDPGTGISRPMESTSLSGKTGVKTQRLRETSSVTPDTGAFTSRTPRSAAISAKQGITKSCNKLERWGNKNTNLILLQTRPSTPKKLGRPNDDLDEWSPHSNIKGNEEEEIMEMGKKIASSPTPLAEKHDKLIANRDNSLLRTQGMSIYQDSKKRKISESSQPRSPPVKVARRNEEPSARYSSGPLISSESANRKHVHSIIGDGSPAGVYPKCVYPALKAARAEYSQRLTEDDLTDICKRITDDIMEQGVETFCPASRDCPKKQRTELILRSVSEAFHERARRLLRPINSISSAENASKGSTNPHFEPNPKISRFEANAPRAGEVRTNIQLQLEPADAESGENGVSAKPAMLHTHEEIDPLPQWRSPEVSHPTVSEPGPYSASPIPAKYVALFESVVYPALKKAKRRHKDVLPWEGLDAICKIIISEVVERLIAHPDESNQLNEDTRTKIQRFVKKSFRRKVRKADAQSSHNPATPPDDPKSEMADPSLASLGLRGVTGGRSIPAGGYHSPPPNLHHSENTSANRPTAVDNQEDVQAPRQPLPKPLDQALSSSLHHSIDKSHQSLDESPPSSFPPGFDRGRYPAQRRRRGNKYYTPPRASNTTPKFEKDRSIPSVSRKLSASAVNQYELEHGLLDTSDQVRLMEASANRPTTLSARATQTLSADAENDRTPRNGNLALELLARKEETKDMRHVTKALREVSAQGPQSALQIPGDSLESISIQRELQPRIRSRLPTAKDPKLEYAVAVLVTDTSPGPSQDGQRYTITPRDQMQLVTEQSIVKHVDRTSKTERAKLVRIETKVIDPVRPPGRSISSLLRNRELGLTSRGRHVATVGELWQMKTEMLEPWKHWKGASGDVVAVAWHPDSNMYAFGAAAHTNVEDIQYNRPCNLLIGTLTSNQIRELPDHRVNRPKPETIPNGPNANPAVYDACDPKVYETVTSVAFSPTEDRIFTASHDCTVKIWDVSGEKSECLSTLGHEGWVTSLEVSEHRPGVFATASKCTKDAVRVYRDSSTFVNFSASRAEIKAEGNIYPECIRWGPNPFTSHLLLAGFQEWEQHEDHFSGRGQLCLWDAYRFESIKVTPSSQSVYAAAWHPTHPFFATGGAPGNNVIDKINTKTVVRTWDFRTPKRYQVEYECPATDMQDVTFSPTNPNIVTAGCTDGSSYVWDWRWPDEILHRLKHGKPLAELDHTKEREEADTGVMLSLWGPGGSLFYTGSSDGTIKAWDVRRHPNDALVRNVANFDVSVQSGAFSPDGHNLLVGDAEGGIHILSSAPSGPRSNVKSTDAYIDLVRASDGSGAKLDSNDDNPGTEGIEAARSLIESGQLEFHKQLGVGQGPNYRGPYAKYARKEMDESSIGRLRRRFEKKQPISKRGEKRDEAFPMTKLLHERRQKLAREKEDGDQMALDDLTERQQKGMERSEGGATSQRSPSFSTTPQGAASQANENSGPTVEDNEIREEEMVEENFWWVRMGEEEIEEARAGRSRS